MRTRWDAGFTLVEVVIVTGIIALVAGAAGTFFLAGTTPAVASANRDVVAAIDEARRTAIAFDAATVVFTPALAGSGYRARVYERFPGDPAFRARNGPTYDSTVAINETASPLGAPGFAFTIDSHGTVSGLANYAPSGSDFTTHACPAAGAFTLQLSYARDTRVVTIPCRLDASAAAPVVFSTPAPAATLTPFPIATCPAGTTCALAQLPPPGGGAQCPNGFVADQTVPGMCDAVAPSPLPTVTAATPTCPPGSPGTFPVCAQYANPTPLPTSVPTPLMIAHCTPGAADASGFASCVVSDPVRATGAAITRTGCGTHVPTNDPGPRFSVDVDVFDNGAPWAAYTVSLSTAKTAWLDEALMPPVALCGLNNTLVFSLAGVEPLAGNASLNPYADTGDPAFVNAGVDAIVQPPLGRWGSDT